jgi:hypothetical protein
MLPWLFECKYATGIITRVWTRSPTVFLMQMRPTSAALRRLFVPFSFRCTPCRRRLRCQHPALTISFVRWSQYTAISNVDRRGKHAWLSTYAGSPVSGTFHVDVTTTSEPDFLVLKSWCGRSHKTSVVVLVFLLDHGVCQV